MSDALTYLMGNRWTKDAEGEFITVEDSYAVPPVSLSVDGKSTQVTTTGKNLIPTTMPSNAIHATMSGSGTNVSATLTSAGNAWIFTIPCERNTQYVYQASRNGAVGGIGLATTESLQVGDTVRKIALMTNYSSYAFSSGEYDYIIVQVGDTTTFNNMPVNKVMISVGSSITDYEPYSGGAASPRPDWPQPILSVDDLGLEIHGKQLMDWEHPFKTGNFYYDENTGSRFYPSSDSDVSVQIDGDNLVISISVGWKGAVFRTPNLPSGTKCYIKIPNGVHSGSGSQYGSNIYIVDKNNVVTRRTSHKASLAVGSYATTLAEGEAAIVFTVGFRSSTTGTITFEKPQIELGSTASQYEPYSGITVSNLLPDGYSLRSLPDGTKDELHLTYLRPSDRPGWAWYDRKLVKRVGCIEDMGTLSWGVNKTASIHKFIASVPNLAYSGWTFNMGYCSCYLRGGGLAISSNAKDGYFYRRATYASILIGDYRFVDPDDLDGFKEFISGETFTYLLATPETISLDPIELPTMQSGLTNLWSDPSTNLSITYERDRNIVISNIKASIDDLATS